MKSCTQASRGLPAAAAAAATAATSKCSSLMGLSASTDAMALDATVSAQWLDNKNPSRVSRGNAVTGSDTPRSTHMMGNLTTEHRAVKRTVRQ